MIMKSHSITIPANRSVTVANLDPGGLTWSAGQAHVGDKKATGAKSVGGWEANRLPWLDLGGTRLRIGTANVGTMRKRDGEVVDMAGRRKLDFCCVQECR